MNNGTLSKKRRSYSNALRERQAGQTQERILEAVAGLLRAGEMEELSYSLVADRAGVSVPTIYRYFPSRKALFDGLDRWLARELKRPAFPRSYRELVESTPEFFRYYQESRDLLSTARVSALLREANQEGRKARDEGVSALLAPYTSHLEPARAKAVHAVVRLLYSFDSFEMMQERFGLGPSEISEAVLWTLRTLVEKLEHERDKADGPGNGRRRPKGSVRGKG
jgi:AcrR family transcriptional regulator